jgi:hypothetical protein
MKNFKPDRLSDSITTRITTTERSFLEQFSAENRVSMGEGIRLLIDKGMDHAKARAKRETVEVINDSM